MLPVNYNEELEKDAGSHWSLLVYGKKTNKFYHYDSMGGANEKYARQIITISSIDNKCFKDEMEKKKSTQQTDRHSCGVHTIMHASKLAGNMVNKGNSETVYKIETEKRWYNKDKKMDKRNHHNQRSHRW